MHREADSRTLLPLYPLYSLFTLFWKYFGTAMAFSPFLSFPFFLHCIRYPSACTAGALFLSEPQTVEVGKTDDFERLYERKRTRMKQTKGVKRRSTGPSSSFSLTDTSTFFSLSLCHKSGPCLLATIAVQSPLHTVGTGANDILKRNREDGLVCCLPHSRARMPTDCSPFYSPGYRECTQV
jgi:hypothetical protein